MNIVDFGKTKDKITERESAKNEKRREMKELYRNLTKNQEIVDILMIQIAKDIQEKFPGVSFRLFSRIKTESSFNAKLENDLTGLTDKKKIDDIKIYDIIGLNIIIEKVPDTIKSNDPSFDSHISELISIKNDTKANLEMHNNQIEKYRKRIEDFQKRKKQKVQLKKVNNNKLKELESLVNDELGIKAYIKQIGEGLDYSIMEIDREIANLEEDIKNMESIIARTRDRFNKENNECNHALADFLIRNMHKFENVKALGITEIPKRLKQKENYDGYRAVHNCFEANVKVKDEKGKEGNFHFICEMQGKSIDAFEVAARGKAAKYHASQEKETGKIAKEQILPDILNIKTKEDIEKFRKNVKKTVPRYRVYSYIPSKKKDEPGNHEVYKLSMKECYMLYYYNHLFGNKHLNLKPQDEQVDELVSGEKLDGNDFQIYRNYNYLDKGEI